MKTRDYLDKNGIIKPFHIEDEVELLKTISSSKPSKRVIIDKKAFKSIQVLVDIINNNNHSFYRELKERIVGHEDKIALFYRCNKISFGEMYEKADKIAMSLAKMGVKQGDEVPVCISNIPELVYLLLAINKLGAKINLFGAQFDKNYLNEILYGCTDKVIIASDDVYGSIKNTIDSRKYDNKVVISLADSLPEHPELSDEYEPELAEYYYFENKAKEYKNSDEKIMLYNEFENYGKDYDQPIIDKGDLNTEFLATYTSGSTKIGHPSKMYHCNRSLIVSGITHDSSVSGNFKMDKFRALAHIHPESNTDIITSIADSLMQLWTVALEPEYDMNKALDYAFINKPNLLGATTTFIVQMVKDYMIKKRFHENGKGRKLGFLVSLFAIGEGVSAGEEKLINKFLRVSRAGSDVKIHGLSFPFVALSIGGGDCEHGGLYYTLWRKLLEKIYYTKLKNKNLGLLPVPHAQVSCFKQGENGLYEECDYNEYGIIAANSITNMSGYDNVEKTKKSIITDTNGRDWLTSNVFGYIDEVGGVHVKGRVNNTISFSSGNIVPSFFIEDIVSVDTKNILSCSVTQSAELSIPVINIQFQPDKKKSDLSVIQSIMDRCIEQIGLDDTLELQYRVIDIKDSFPVTCSGKRDIRALEQMEDKYLYNSSINNKIESDAKVYQKKNNKNHIL